MQVQTDLRRLLRDEFLVGASLYIAAVMVGLRFGMPALDAALMERWSWNLDPYMPLIASYMAAALGGTLVGILGGLLLLEMREENTIAAILVAPWSVRRLLAAESAAAYGLGVGLILLQAYVAGVALPPMTLLLPIAMVFGLFAPIFMLTVATFASSKLEAFALLKIVSLLALAPAAAFFVPEPWQWGAAVFPPYGAMKAWWHAAAASGTVWPWLATGAVVQALWLLGLARRFLADVRH